MADYSVGGINLQFSVNAKEVTKNLDKITNGLKAVQKAIGQMYNGTIDKDLKSFVTNLNALAHINFEGIATSFSQLANPKIASDMNSVSASFEQLGKAIRQVQNINIQEFATNLETISKSDFGSLTSSLSSLNNLEPKSLSAFTSAIRNINKMGQDNVPFDKIKQHFQEMADAVEPFLQKLKEARPELEHFSNALDLSRVNAQMVDTELKLARIDEVTSRTASRKVLDDLKIQKANYQLEKTKISLEKIKGSIKTTSDGFSKLFNLGKLYFLFNYTKRLGQAIGRIISSAIDFEETLNKFQVSFGEYTTEATKFANQLTNAFNLSRESIMNYMSTFNNMIKSLGGVKGEDALGLSKVLTQMAIDYASLMNTSIDTAMQQFQSVLAGQTKAIRTTSGVDVTDNTIMQMYQALGGTKTQRQLTQTEKRLLRILAVEKQLSELGAFGFNKETGKFTSDFEKTINSTANNLKRISQTFKEMSVYLGNILKEYLQPIVEKALTFMIVLKEIVKSFATLRNISTKEYENGIGSIFGEANEEAEELQKTMNGLLSFDKFEALGTKDKKDTEDTDRILSAIKEYQTQFDQIENNANKLAETFLESLGYSKQLTEDGLDYVWVLGEETDKLKEIKGTLGTIGGVIAGLIATKSITKIAGVIKTLTTVLGGGKIALMITAVTAVISYLGATDKDFRETLKQLGGVIKDLIMTLLPAIKSILNSITPILKTLAQLVGNIVQYVAPTLERLFKFISGVVKVVAPVVTLILGAINAIINLVRFLKQEFGKWADGFFGKMVTGHPFQALKELFNGNFFANGGFPTKGQMFVANESGAELVGNIGGRTAVANNDMIVQAIENASYKGIVRGMAIANNRQDINLNVNGLNNNEIARALYKPLIKEFERNGVKLQGA